MKFLSRLSERQARLVGRSVFVFSLLLVGGLFAAQKVYSGPPYFRCVEGNFGAGSYMSSGPYAGSCLYTRTADLAVSTTLHTQCLDGDPNDHDPQEGTANPHPGGQTCDPWSTATNKVEHGTQRHLQWYSDP